MINIQNIGDNKCFKWSIIRYLNPVDCNPAKITTADKKFAKNFDFKDTKPLVKIRDIYKIKKKRRILSVLLFLIMKIKKNIQSMY